jgi:putative hydrolase of the HAD superfamily
VQIKGIFFDLGGTLFSYNGRRGGGGIRYVLETLGLDASPEEVGRAWQAANQQVGEHYGKQRYFLHKDLFRDTLTQFLAEFDHQPANDLLEEFHVRQRDAMLENLPIRDECHDALVALKDRGLYLSIVSNIDDDYLYPLVEKHGLDNLLDHCTSSEEARSCKPDTEIFHYSLNKSGLEREHVLFVGDSLHHDVAGADAVGMRSVRIVEEGVVTPLTHGLEITADPTYEITSLHDLLDIVVQHNG